MKTVIYHNPRCSKSREVLALLRHKNYNVEVIEYMKYAPTEKQLKELVDLLGIKPLQLIRIKEETFKPYKDKQLTDSECIALMAEFPVLIERPIVVKNKKAVIGRPPQLVLDIL
jgi:arsenate reductase